MIRGAGLTLLCVLAATLCAAWAMCAFRPILARAWRRTASLWRGLDWVGRAALCAVLCVCGYRGATKSIMSKTGHDDSIGIVSAEIASGGAVTNLVPQGMIESFGHGTNIFAYAFSATNLQMSADAFAEKVWWRETNREQWSNATNSSALPDGLHVYWGTETSSPTTTVYFLYGPTNNFSHAMLYVGDDLPPVYIETEGGVTLDAVRMTSKLLTVTYTVDQSALIGPAQIVIEESLLNEYGNWSGQWDEMRTVTAEAGTHQEQFVGFFVNRRRMIRLRLLVEVEGNQ